MRKTNNRYAIYALSKDNGVGFFFTMGEGTAFLSLSHAKTFPSKKKAKRVLKRLNCYHPAPSRWRIVDLDVLNSKLEQSVEKSI